ncbi:MAG TPA: 50S ribosomal protein L11 methyltransferase [Alphaproteobacteria bacterium]|jgi:predicted nicotinamide N-methyase|nr:50S ribosomal protein L11 methyltransferase [Alphaproteobacteria bacterium]
MDVLKAARDPVAFIRANTAVEAPRLVPEIELHLASEITPIWEATEASLEQAGLPPPYWAFAWAGGQALARYILDNPETVRGRVVLDFGAGSGLVAIAAAKAGAARVIAADIDDFAAAAIRLNAAHNNVVVERVTDDVIGRVEGFDAVLVGDMCYERPLADRVEAWLRELAARGTAVLIGDPGRTYFPKAGVERIARYSVHTTREIEDTDLRLTGVWRIAPAVTAGR